MENKVTHFNLIRSEPPAVAGGLSFTIIVYSAETHPLPQMVLTYPKLSGSLYLTSVTKCTEFFTLEKFF